MTFDISPEPQIQALVSSTFEKKIGDQVRLTLNLLFNPDTERSLLLEKVTKDYLKRFKKIIVSMIFYWLNSRLLI